MYRLGSLILGLAGIGAKGIADLAAPPGGLTLRPLPGIIAGTDAAGKPFLCRQGDAAPGCASVAAWQSDVETLGRDLFDGDGHVLRALYREPVEK
jgi:hypothetical protein